MIFSLRWALLLPGLAEQSAVNRDNAAAYLRLSQIGAWQPFSPSNHYLLNMKAQIIHKIN
jgi:hypothetical protein